MLENSNLPKLFPDDDGVAGVDAILEYRAVTALGVTPIVASIVLKSSVNERMPGVVVVAFAIAFMEIVMPPFPETATFTFAP